MAKLLRKINFRAKTIHKSIFDFRQMIPTSNSTQPIWRKQITIEMIEKEPRNSTFGTLKQVGYASEFGYPT